MTTPNTARKPFTITVKHFFIIAALVICALAADAGIIGYLAWQGAQDKPPDAAAGAAYLEDGASLPWIRDRVPCAIYWKHLRGLYWAAQKSPPNDYPKLIRTLERATTEAWLCEWQLGPVR